MIKRLAMPESIRDKEVMTTFEVQLEAKLNELIDVVNPLIEQVDTIGAMEEPRSIGSVVSAEAGVFPFPRPKESKESELLSPPRLTRGSYSYEQALADHDAVEELNTIVDQAVKEYKDRVLKVLDDYEETTAAKLVRAIHG